MKFRCASHMSEIFESPEKYGKIVDRIADQLETLRNKQSFTGIVFTGQSGAAMAYPMSARLHIPLICVRKAGENSHGHSVEGPLANVRRFIILDDFMESGKTIKRLLTAMDNANKENNPSTGNHLRCGAIVLWNERNGGSWRDTSFTYKKKKIPIHYWG